MRYYENGDRKNAILIKQIVIEGQNAILMKHIVIEGQIYLTIIEFGFRWILLLRHTLRPQMVQMVFI